MKVLLLLCFVCQRLLSYLFSTVNRSVMLVLTTVELRMPCQQTRSIVSISRNGIYASLSFLPVKTNSSLREYWRGGNGERQSKSSNDNKVSRRPKEKNSLGSKEWCLVDIVCQKYRNFITHTSSCSFLPFTKFISRLGMPIDYHYDPPDISVNTAEKSVNLF